jgi:hypothetical protein
MDSPIPSADLKIEGQATLREVRLRWKALLGKASHVLSLLNGIRDRLPAPSTEGFQILVHG